MEIEIKLNEFMESLGRQPGGRIIPLREVPEEGGRIKPELN